MLNKGQTIDRYTVDSVIGHGGTAVVYLVKHNQLGSQHALKVLSLTSGAIRERLLREGRVQAAMQHNNIVTVTDVLNVDGSPGLLMEHVDGPSLDVAMKRYKIALLDAQTLFRGIVSGVREAHRHGLVHRDLKPANVLLFPSPEGFVPKVTDFGLAKVVVGRTAEIGQTRQGIAMGTPAYMAPEQIRDARSVDKRADIFSLGCILYELVTRQRAFPGEQALEIYNNIVAGRYTPPQELVPSLPTPLIDAIDGCLVLDREDRIPDCDTLLAVLSGKLSWDVDDHLVHDDVLPTEEIARDVPIIPIAMRKITPGPAMPRSLQPGMLDPEPHTTQSDGGTLGGDRSLVPEDDEPSLSVVRPPELQKRPRRGLIFLAGAALLFMVFGLMLLTLLLWGLGFGDAAGRMVGFTSPDQGLQLSVPEPAPVQVAEVPEPVALPPEANFVPEVADPPMPDPVRPVPAVARRPVVAAPSPATVRFYSKPISVHLWVDGEKHKRTPRKLELLPGRHTVRMKNLENEVVYEVNVAADGTNTWCYSFLDDGLTTGRCQ